MYVQGPTSSEIRPLPCGRSLGSVHSVNGFVGNPGAPIPRAYALKKSASPSLVKALCIFLTVIIIIIIDARVPSPPHFQPHRPHHHHLHFLSVALLHVEIAAFLYYCFLPTLINIYILSSRTKYFFTSYIRVILLYSTTATDHHSIFLRRRRDGTQHSHNCIQVLCSYTRQ